jgi:hypothetical protein
LEKDWQTAADIRGDALEKYINREGKKKVASLNEREDLLLTGGPFEGSASRKARTRISRYAPLSHVTVIRASFPRCCSVGKTTKLDGVLCQFAKNC